MLYPATLVFSFVAAAIGLSTSSYASVIVMASLVPFTIEWVGDQLDIVGYSALRSTAVSLVAAGGLGVALAVHIADPFSASVTAPIGVAVGVCVVASIVGRRRQDNRDDSSSWIERFEDAEALRIQRHRELLAAMDEVDG